ncbi:MAG TPA: acetyl-CoA carboxylase, carboxyltransferase subunit beta [Ktedonobacterales bacterium]|nr:acetyl-CoA carboxylase, carboxyltransferase subunit beta [Ktedonobacterales bacterium]
MKDESQPALTVDSQNGAHTGTIPRALPDNLAVKCPNCKELLISKDWEKNQRVCQRCGHHFRLSAPERIELLLDPDSFQEMAGDLQPTDPLGFVSRSQSYRSKLQSESANSGLTEGVVIGRGMIEDLPLMIAIMDFRFIGGSMGSVVGEKLTRAIEQAATDHIPLLIISSSGGARMQEGLTALMQMAKTSAALAKLNEAGVPYISLMTDPTTGGVAASFASLGDVILAEPGARICFTGPRVIEQFMHMKLPKDTGSSEFCLQHGMIDGIVHRRVLRATLARLLRLYAGKARVTD